jgi:hypothetical protein
MTGWMSKRAGSRLGTLLIIRGFDCILVTVHVEDTHVTVHAPALPQADRFVVANPTYWGEKRCSIDSDGSA